MRSIILLAVTYFYGVSVNVSNFLLGVNQFRKAFFFCLEKANSFLDKWQTTCNGLKFEIIPGFLNKFSHSSNKPQGAGQVSRILRRERSFVQLNRRYVGVIKCAQKRLSSGLFFFYYFQGLKAVKCVAQAFLCGAYCNELFGVLIQLALNIFNNVLCCLKLYLFSCFRDSPSSCDYSGNGCCPTTPGANPAAPTVTHVRRRGKARTGVVEQHPSNEQSDCDKGPECEPNSRFFHGVIFSTRQLSRGVCA